MNLDGKVAGGRSSSMVGRDAHDVRIARIHERSDELADIGP